MTWVRTRLFTSLGGRAAFALICLFSCPSYAKSGAVVAREVGTITKSCRSIDAAEKANGLTAQFFSLATSASSAAWAKFGTQEELQKACPNGCYKKAVAYFEGPALVLASFELKSTTKEWVHYIEYYFRNDGTLQKIHSDFRRFGAYERSKGMEQEFLVRVLRDRFYDSTGKLLKKSAPRFLNMSNGREARDVVFTDEPWTVYLKSEKLPFSNLLDTPTPDEKNKN